MQEMAGHALRQFIAQLKTFANLHHITATFIPAAEDAPALTINGGVRETFVLRAQVRLDRKSVV